MPLILSNVIEMPLGLLSDMGYRRVLILGGGVMFALAILLAALSHSFTALLAAFILLFPASGAFVSLAQADLMAGDPDRHEQNMARWTFAGSLGVVIGPLTLGATVGLGIGWRGLFVGVAMLAGILTALFALHRNHAPPEGSAHPAPGKGLLEGLKGTLTALRQREVLRWLILLQFADLMLDILLGYLALYMVDVAGASPAQAGIAVIVWSGVGLLGDFLLIPLLERVRGLDYLRVSVLAELILYPAFLLIPGLWPKLITLGLLGLFNSGWYAILQARLYSSLPGRPGAALAANNAASLVGACLPLVIGLAAGQFGLAAAMWLMLAGPIILLIGLPRRES